jgi:hypothetical protein
MARLARMLIEKNQGVAARCVDLVQELLGDAAA